MTTDQTSNSCVGNLEIFPSPGDLPNSGIEPRSPALQVDSLLSDHQMRQLSPLSHVFVYFTISLSLSFFFLIGAHGALGFQASALRAPFEPTRRFLFFFFFNVFIYCLAVKGLIHGLRDLHHDM